MADTLDAKTVLKDLVLVQNGKVVTGEPVRDNYAVHAKSGSALTALPATEVVKVLKAAYPLCTFTFCAKPPPEKK